MIALMVILTNTDVFPFASNTYFIYYGRPLLWLGVAFIVYKFPRQRAVGRLSLRRFIIQMAVWAAVIHLIFMMVGGLISGFGRSPYAFGLVTSTINFLYVASLLLGVEAARAYLINSYKGKRPVLVIGLISLFLMFTELTFTEFRNFAEPVKVVRFVGSIFLPVFAQNILTTYFAYLGGFVPAAVYHGILMAFEWFFPILPKMTWPMKTFLGCFVPVFMLLSVRHFYLLQARAIKRVTTDSEELFGWLVSSIISVVIIWFAVGLFPVYPSVIVTGSMEPMIKPGDIVLVQKIKGEEAQVGDVIQYYDIENEVYITHRVIAFKEEGKRTLVTKGDNNSSADAQPVSLEQVKGRVIKVLPKIGWLSLILRSNNPIPEGVIN
jgi:signal peptidase